jgi:hypothetical protein
VARIERSLAKDSESRFSGTNAFTVSVDNTHDKAVYDVGIPNFLGFSVLLDVECRDPYRFAALV